jgi:gamma-glutamyl phosphate reductase
MKYRTNLERETEVEIYLNPNEDWEEIVKEFSECIYSIDSLEELVQFIARHVSQHGETFIEGVGSCDEINYNEPDFTNKQNISVIYRITNDGFNETDVEEIK